MYGILQSGLSVPVAWLFCCGMQWSDPRRQALDEMDALLSLPPHAVQTDQDVGAILGHLLKYAPYLYAGEFLQLIEFFARTQPLLVVPERFALEGQVACRIAAE